MTCFWELTPSICKKNFFQLFFRQFFIFSSKNEEKCQKRVINIFNQLSGDLTPESWLKYMISDDTGIWLFTYTISVSKQKIFWHFFTSILFLRKCLLCDICFFLYLFRSFFFSVGITFFSHLCLSFLIFSILISYLNSFTT